MKISYDKEAKILGLRLSSKKSIDSDVQNNVVIDRDKDGNVVNIEIMSVGMGEYKKAKSPLAKIARLMGAK